MKKALIFVASNTYLLAGRKPCNRKGFFCAYTRVFAIDTATCPYRAGCAPVARLTGVFDSDNVASRFSFCRKKCRTHHALPFFNPPSNLAKTRGFFVKQTRCQQEA